MRQKITKGKRKVLSAVRPNTGLEEAYRRRLVDLVEEMHRSIIYWVKRAYAANQPEIAQDASPAYTMRTLMNRLARRWQRKFDQAAKELATYFARSAASRSDRALAAILKKHGMTVDFKMTDKANDVMQATIGEQVGLIRSIANQHLTDVEGKVMRSVARGRDLGSLAADLEKSYDLSKKRAALIARDQNNKATATMTRVRQGELGIKQAIWVHSAGGKVPRPSHVKAGREKMVYDITKGAFIDGEFIFPGELINCRCVSKSIIPGFNS
jgi:uncharacterized protein with gpF-like domain